MSTYDWKILCSTVNCGNTAIYKPLTKQSTAKLSKTKKNKENKKEQGKTRKDKERQGKTRKDKEEQVK